MSDEDELRTEWLRILDWNAESEPVPDSWYDAYRREVEAQHAAAKSAWPSGCNHPNSCSRNRTCMYFGCRHQQRDIRPEIDAALVAQTSSAL